MAKTQYSLSTDAAAKVTSIKLRFLFKQFIPHNSDHFFTIDFDREYQLASEFSFAMYALLSVLATSTPYVETS